MSVKATWLFNGVSANGLKMYGFSETWYSGLAGNPLIAQMDLISDLRRLFLARDTEIIGYRIGQDGGRSYVVRKSFLAPASNEPGNLPVDALSCQVGVVGSPSIKRFFIHDLPDNYISNGTFDDLEAAGMLGLIKAYADLNFQVRYQNPAAPNAMILSIDGTGNVTTTANIALAVNNTVSFLNCKDVNGKTVRGTYIVETVTDGLHFKVAHWPGNTVGRKGKVRLVSFLFAAASYLGPSRSIIEPASRKVGRPFFQSRGRVPTRR
jgi:hypothetical protein